MKHIKGILKISIVLLLLLVCVGSIYASDSSQNVLGETGGDDFDLDEDLDDLDDDSLDDDSDLDDDDLDEDDDFDEDDEDFDDDLDEDDEEFDDEDEDDEDWDWDEDADWQFDEDFNESDFNYTDYNFTDFEYLKIKITYYLDRYGNCSEYNWTESEKFLNEYQTYILNTTDYRLNESAEGYETYVKIFDSITSTFEDYNLTENETDYLKFMVIYYLNNYGNVSANYTWNESESFANFSLPKYLLGAIYYDIAGIAGSASATAPFKHSTFMASLDPIYASLTNSTDGNQTSTDNNDNMETPYPPDYSEGSILILVLVMIVAILMIV